MVIKYVAGDGTGDYDADGSGDQEPINKALLWASNNPGNEVHLTGPFSFDIQSSVLMGSYTKFSGDSNAILRLNNSCAWGSGVPIITQIGGLGRNIPKDIEICGFQMDGNESHLYGVGGRLRGQGYYNMVHLQGQKARHGSNIKVHDMTMYNGLGDGPRLVFCDDVQVYNCDLSNLMHCSVFCIECLNPRAYNNTIQAISCSGIRYDHCRNGKIYSNHITDFTGTTHAPKYGEYGVQIGLQPPRYGHTTLVDNIVIQDNIIDVSGSGIQLEDYLKTAGNTAQNVTICNNQIRGGKSNNTNYFSGIAIYSWGNGLVISKNTIDGSGRAGILGYSSIVAGAKVYVTNNNIINSVMLNSGGGYGIWNKASNLKILASGNYLHGNMSGNYKGLTPLSEADSLIADAVPGGNPGTPVNPDDPDLPDPPDPPDPDPPDPVDPVDPYDPIEPVDPNPPAVGCRGFATLVNGRYAFQPFRVADAGDKVLLVPVSNGYMLLKLASDLNTGSSITMIKDNKGNYYAIEGV